jgi:hypothetical protein
MARRPPRNESRNARSGPIDVEATQVLNGVVSAGALENLLVKQGVTVSANVRFGPVATV